MRLLTSPQPFSDEQLEELFDTCALPDIGRETVRRIRASEPVDRDRAHGNNVCTRYPSLKMRRTIHTASRNCELVAVVSWDFDPVVYEVWDRPGILSLTYQGNGRTVHGDTRPDFFLVQGRKPHFCYVECKPDDAVAGLLEDGSERWERGADGVVRCPPADRALAPSGISFRLWTPGQVDHTKLRNIRFLADYAGEEVAAGVAARVRELVSRQPGMTVEDALGEVADANTLYALITSGVLRVDLEKYDFRKPESVPLFADTRSLRIWEAALASRGPGPGAARRAGAANRRALSELADAALRGAGPEATDEALERLRVIRDVLDGRCSAKDVAKGGANAKSRSGRKTKTARRKRRKAKAAGRYEVPLGTVYTWLRAYRNAERDVGCGFVGLIPDWKKSGRRCLRFEKSVYVAMDEVAKDIHETADAPSVRKTHKDFRKKMLAAGFSVLPCEKTYRSYLNARNRDRQTEKREGRRTRIAQAMWLDDSWEVFAKEGCRPLDVVQIDHTQLDIFIVVWDRSGNWRVLHLKPWLTLAICVWSRKVLGHSLSLDAPSAEACMEVLRDILRREIVRTGTGKGRLPAGAAVDQASEFHSTNFEANCGWYRIEKIERPASKPRFGAVIERLFGTVNTRRIHDLPGNSKYHKNARKMSREVDARRRAELSLADLEAELESFLYGEYNATTHSSLGMSPDRKFEEGVRKLGYPESRQVAYDADFVFRTMVSAKSGTAMVSAPGMIQIENVRYVHDALRLDGVMGTRVPVKVDNDDAGYVVAWIEASNDWVVCEARNQYRVFQGVSRRVLCIARKIVLEEANGNPVDEQRWLESIERLSEDRRIRMQRLRDEERQLARTGKPAQPVREDASDADASDEPTHRDDAVSDVADRSWSGIGKPVEFTL